MFSSKQQLAAPLRDYLRDAGHDSVVYGNTGEGKLGVIALSANQLRIVKRESLHTPPESITSKQTRSVTHPARPQATPVTP